MEIYRVKRSNSKISNRRPFPPQIATVVMLSGLFLAGGVGAAWFTGNCRIDRLFTQLDWVQQSPPLWLSVPSASIWVLLLPTVLALLLVQLVMKLSPEPRRWSRAIVVGVVLAFMIRYVVWRSLATLNLSDPLNGVFSLGLLGLELLTITCAIIPLSLMLRFKDRRHEANINAIAVREGTFLPSVDVLIPTYNEPEFILRRTVIGCQALDYPHKRVYLLDDTRRPAVQQLAAELGCEYMTRPDGRYAKAGNLNHAITKTDGDLIVVFDADFVPTKNFLTRTVGFFQDEQLALVQTPQSFYNADPIARNLGLENVLTPDEESFYRQLQPIRDGVGTAICTGTSFVVRRRALEATGGFVTESLSEDYFTGIRLSASGYRVIYLNEKLSAGLAADTIVAHAAQRLRWARGTLQAFFIAMNPLTVRGLRPIQRLAYFEGLLVWFTSISRVGFMLMPLTYVFFGLLPVRTSSTEAIYFFLPYCFVQLAVSAWLNQRSRSALFADVYTVLLAFPIALTVVQAMLNPFGREFKVTPKGTTRDRAVFNWTLALPLVVVFGLSIVSLVLVSGQVLADPASDLTAKQRTVDLGWIWISYNVLIIGVALLTFRDVPKLDPYEWFDRRCVVALQTSAPSTAECTALQWGHTTLVSERGVDVLLPQTLVDWQDTEPLQVTVTLPDAELTVAGTVTQIRRPPTGTIVRIRFDALTLTAERRLIEWLYCQPGQWQPQFVPGELKSLGLLLRLLLTPITECIALINWQHQHRRR